MREHLVMHFIFTIKLQAQTGQIIPDNAQQVGRNKKIGLAPMQHLLQVLENEMETAR